MNSVPNLNALLTERFFIFDDEEKLAYFAKLVYPESSDSFLETVFGLSTGTIARVSTADGE